MIVLPSQVANTVASCIVVTASLVFVGVYAWRAPWRSTSIGWLLMVLAAAIGGFGGYTVALAAWPHSGWVTFGLRIARVVLQLAVATVLVWFATLVIRAQSGEQGDTNGEHR